MIEDAAHDGQRWVRLCRRGRKNASETRDITISNDVGPKKKLTSSFMNLVFCRGSSALRSDPPDFDDENCGNTNCALDASAALSLSLFALAAAAADAIVVVVPSLIMSNICESEGPGDDEDEDDSFLVARLRSSAFRSAPVVIVEAGRWKSALDASAAISLALFGLLPSSPSSFPPPTPFMLYLAVPSSVKSCTRLPNLSSRSVRFLGVGRRDLRSDDTKGEEDVGESSSSSDAADLGPRPELPPRR